MALNVCKYQSLHISTHENLLQHILYIKNTQNKEHSTRRTFHTKTILCKETTTQSTLQTKHCKLQINKVLHKKVIRTKLKMFSAEQGDFF